MKCAMHNPETAPAAIATLTVNGHPVPLCGPCFDTEIDAAIALDAAHAEVAAAVATPVDAIEVTVDVINVTMVTDPDEIKRIASLVADAD